MGKYFNTPVGTTVLTIITTTTTTTTTITTTTTTTTTTTGWYLFYCCFLQVSTNGYITLGNKFDRASPNNITNAFPPGVKMIAPYWMDLDTRSEATDAETVESGLFTWYYSIESNLTDTVVSDMYTRARMLLNKYPRSENFQNFQPSYLFVATWYNASAYPSSLYSPTEVCVM